MRTMEILYKIDGGVKVRIPGWANGEKKDVVITQTIIDSVGECVMLDMAFERSQLNDLIFILGQAKKEYGLPE